MFLIKVFMDKIPIIGTTPLFSDILYGFIASTAGLNPLIGLVISLSHKFFSIISLSIIFLLFNFFFIFKKNYY